jgi:hypothetical protein
MGKHRSENLQNRFEEPPAGDSVRAVLVCALSHYSLASSALYADEYGDSIYQASVTKRSPGIETRRISPAEWNDCSAILSAEMTYTESNHVWALRHGIY